MLNLEKVDKARLDVEITSTPLTIDYFMWGTEVSRVVEVRYQVALTVAAHRELGIELESQVEFDDAILICSMIEVKNGLATYYFETSVVKRI